MTALVPRHGLMTHVAKLAGVSVGTVSKVVHGKRDVGAATRARVSELLAESGWEPQQGVIPRQRVLVVTRDLDSPYPVELVRGLVEATTGSQLHLVLGTTLHRSVSEWLDLCASPDVLGMVLVISRMTERDHQRVLDTRVPVVLIDALNEPMPGVPNLGVTNWSGARDAVAHLIDLGHTRIGLVAGRPHSPAGGARMQGYRAALHESGLTFDPQLVRNTDFDFTEGIDAALSLLRNADPPTAIFATSDAQALGVLEAARQVGVVVPDSLSVVSFDDTSAAATSSPPLTAIRQPFEELGQVALQLLTQAAGGTVASIDQYELATRLTVRASTAPPPLGRSTPPYRQRAPYARSTEAGVPPAGVPV